MSETRICANCGAEHSIEDMYQVGLALRGLQPHYSP